MVLKPEQRRLMNIMEFSNKVWRWVCGILLGVCLLVTLGLGLKDRHRVQKFEAERIELQDSILSLREEAATRDQATAVLSQDWQQDRDRYTAETAILRSELAKTQRNYRKALEEMKDLDTSELKTYFASRYGQCADTVVDSARFLLTVDVGNHIRYDLADLDFCAEESDLKDSLIVEQNRYIGNLDTMVFVLTVDKTYFKNRADSYEQQWNSSEQARRNIQASLDKQQTLTCLLGGTAAVLVIGLISSIILGGK